MSAGSVLPGTGEWIEEPPGDLGGFMPDRLTVAALCEKFGDVCESAVDPLEIASALEFEGYGDRAAREDYGVRDIFALAQAMYRRVPRKPAAPQPAQDPWRLSRARPLLHGLLYALPAVCFPAAGTLVAAPGVLPALVVALLVAWGLSQGLACVGYLRLGTAGQAQARRVLRSGMLFGLAGVALAMAAIWLTVRARPVVLTFGAGEGVYMLGACVLMVAGEERWLPAALAPGVLGGAAFLILGRPPGLQHLDWISLAATPLLACAMALVITRTPGPRTRGPRKGGPGSGGLGSGGPGSGGLPSPAELRAAVPAAAFGVVAAGLLTFPVIAGPRSGAGVNVGALVAAVPLSLSMGAAEWSLLWYRRRTRRLLRTTGDVRSFGLRARLALLAAWLQYVGGTFILLAAGFALAVASGLVHLDRTAVPEAAGYLVLGSGMFLALLLQTMWVRALPLAAAAVALAVELVFRRYGVAIGLAVPIGLLLVIGGYATAVLGGAVRHGY